MVSVRHSTILGTLCKGVPNRLKRTVSNLMTANDLESRSQGQLASDTNLVRRAQRGDTEAFSELVRLYQRRAVSVAWRILGNVEDASDVSQEAFVRAYRNLAQLADPTKFGAWLLRTVSNLALNYRRSRATRKTVALEDLECLQDDHSPDAAGSSTGHPGQAIGPLSDELQKAISGAIEELPEPQRLALVLFSVEGVPQKEVAEILECSVELVKWNVFQARKKLKTALADFL